MSTGRAPGVSAAALPPSKPQRVLACLLCQQRKVKCDRKFPCATCTMSRAQCVPATQVSRRRKRRFPEWELLERIRKYEDMLRQNNIRFEPLHKDSAGGEEESPNVKSGYDSGYEQPKPLGPGCSSPLTTVNSEIVYEAKNIWHVVRPQEPDNDSDSSDDEVSEVVVHKAWDQLFENNDHLLFGPRKTTVDLSTLHPEPVQIFRLWQIYLDNINPLLKVTHTPSLQGRIIEASGNLTDISPALEALMFSIYCISILSLTVDDCQAMFGTSKKDILARYQPICQQALSNCGFLRSSNYDCLTALYLYLVSLRSTTVPESLSSMLGVAIRIAQRMGIHSELALARCGVLEAEMRRRLWWSLVLFDTRIGELAGYKSVTLAPTWDCRVPLNVNDSDLRLRMNESPAAQKTPTEAIFSVVHGELGEFVRHAMFHLDFTNPALKPIVKDFQNGLAPGGSELLALEEMIENKYLQFCDPENPLHFMTIWTARAYLAKCCLIEQYSKYTSLSVDQTEVYYEAVASAALRMLACDTKIMTSPHTKGFLWLVHINFPFPAYLQVIQGLRRQPIGAQADHAWEVMSDNYEARFDYEGRFFILVGEDNPVFKIFTKAIIQAWEARESVSRELEEPLVPPRIVSSIRQKITKMAQSSQGAADIEHPANVIDMGVDEFSMLMPVNFNSYNPSYRRQYSPLTPGSGVRSNMFGQLPLDFDINQLDWAVAQQNWMDTHDL